MMRKPLWLVFCLCACGPASRDDSPGARIEVAPPDLVVEVIDNAAVVQPYTATHISSDGDRTDVTAEAVFTVAQSAVGSWSGPSLTITGGAAGPTRVVAQLDDVIGDTGLTVMVTGHRVDGTGVPPNAPEMFDTASETAGRAPTIAYPDDNILVPPNLGEFDVHWRDTGGNNLYEISLKNQYVDLKIYKAGTGDQFTIYTPNEWFAIAASSEALQLTIAGLNLATPTMKGTTTPQTVDVTNESVAGGVYYWTTQPTQGVYRYDMSLPNVPPSSYFPPGTEPTPCLGCHGLSKDGTKMALTLDSGDGRGTILNVADRSVLVPYDTNPQYWNFATFTPDANQLVTVYHGQMALRSANGSVISMLPNTGAMLATHPELSPDGTRLANVETTNLFYDFQVNDGAIVTRTFDQVTGTFGAITPLVPNAPSASNYYPSWSPDGQWIAFTRTAGNSYNDASATAWVVKADGTMPPIQLSLANKGTGGLTNSWSRWTPFASTTGDANEQVFYLTFSTTRPFGVRPTSGTQIWMTPFYPARAAQGLDPSGPAFRMPFQLLTSANHIAQWTEQVIVLE
jgi:hypothetical protein